jgi:hypothetical protein
VFALALSPSPFAFAQKKDHGAKASVASNARSTDAIKGPREDTQNLFEKFLKKPAVDDATKKAGQTLALKSQKFVHGPTPLATGNELLALKCYQEGYNVQINETLLDPASAPDEHKVVTEALRSVVSRSRLDAGALLFRGQTGLYDGQEKLKAGDTFSSKRFLSTSLNPLVSKDFSMQEQDGVSVFDVIQVDRAGLPGIDLNATKKNGAISAPSKNLGDWNKLACGSEETNDMNFEAEVILPPNAKFRVLKIEKKKADGRTWMIRYLEYLGV